MKDIDRAKFGGDHLASIRQLMPETVGEKAPTEQQIEVAALWDMVTGSNTVIQNARRRHYTSPTLNQDEIGTLESKFFSAPEKRRNAARELIKEDL